MEKEKPIKKPKLVARLMLNMTREEKRMAEQLAAKWNSASASWAIRQCIRRIAEEEGV